MAPCAALVGLRRRLGRSDAATAREAALEDAVLTVVISLSMAVLVSELLFVGHAFTMPRAMLVLAGLTTAAALTQRRS